MNGTAERAAQVDVVDDDLVGEIMSPGGSGRRALILIVLALVISTLTAGLFKLAIEAALPHSESLQKQVRYRVGDSNEAGSSSQSSTVSIGSSSAEEPAAGYSYDLGRAARRYLLLVGLALFIGLRSWLPWSRAFRQGISRARDRLRLAGYGLSIAALLVALYTAILLVGGFVSPASPALDYMARKIPEYLAAACLVAFIEELFFRGIVFRGLVRDYGVRVGLVVSSAVYAVVHCISGGYRVVPGWEPLIGFRLMGAYYTDGGGSVLPDLRLVIGLFLLGLILAYLYLRTGSLWASMGLHAGVVMLSKLLKKLVDREEAFIDWLLGDPLFIVSGAVCWILLAAAMALVVRTAPRGGLYLRLQRQSRS